MGDNHSADETATDFDDYEPETVMVAIEGVPVKEVREMTEAEYESQYWHETIHGRPQVVVLENGVKLFPAQDSEGNGPGALFGETDDGVGFFLG